MKKMILFSALAVTGLVSRAQNMFGIQAGANFASYSLDPKTSGQSKETSNSKAGFLIGALADVNFGSSISFRPELNFIQKGGKREYTYVSGFNSSTTQESKLTLSYIQLSPNFVYNIPAGSGKLFLGLGPEFSFGIGGKDEFTNTTSTTTGTVVTTTTTTGKYDVKFDGDDKATDGKNHYKSFDFGANFLAGFKMRKGLFLSAGYTLGFANIYPNDKKENKNRGFNLKLGYMFGSGMMKK